MSCINKLTANIAYDCSGSNRPKAGLETTAVLINRNDIDLTALTESGATITNLSLLSGASAYSISWIRQLGTTGADFVKNDSGVNYLTNKFACRIFGQSAEDSERVNELMNGEFCVIVESKWKGEDNKAAFKVFGLESGLTMSEGSFVSNENDGSFLFSLSSDENAGGEAYPSRVLLMTDYATTKAAVAALYAQ